MQHVPVLEDLKALVADPAIGAAAALLIERTYLAPELDTEALLAVSAAARLCSFRTLALLLKADWEQRDTACDPWRPWHDLPRWSAIVAQAAPRSSPLQLEVLLLEQWGLGCHHLASESLVPLAERHARSLEILHAAAPEAQAGFLGDKQCWLLLEFELASLTDVRVQLVDAMEHARMAFLASFHDAYTKLVAAANRYALWRYRECSGDLTLTELELRVRLDIDLAPDCEQPLLELEPALAAILRDRELRTDLDSMRHLADLVQRGQVKPASPEEIVHATTLFRRLARRIHPDALHHHPQYPCIAAENLEKLQNIWVAASATHRNRLHLERKRLLDYVRNLEDWDRQVTQILRHLDFHDPGKIITGDTLEEQWTQLRCALDEVTRYLHAMREDLAQLDNDPQHLERCRLNALPERLQQLERARMLRQARIWRRAADEIERRMSQRAAAEQAAEAALLKGTGP